MKRWVIWEHRVREAEVFRMAPNGKFCRIFHEMGPMLMRGMNFFETKKEAQQALMFDLESDMLAAQHRLAELMEEVEQDADDHREPTGGTLHG